MKIQKFNESKKNWTIQGIKNNIEETRYLRDILEQYLYWKFNTDKNELS
jgi:hypothetical protein